VTAPLPGWTDDYNLNAVWCRLLVDELVAAGVRDVVLCPGGRSASLALQVRNDPRLSATVQTDERTGAFIALGMARASARPVAVCTTSGSAVGNLVPALLEADASGIPLVLLTCDRPVAYRGTGAGQTTDQLAICAPFVRSALDLPEPGDDQATAAEALTAVAEVLSRAVQPGREGPVQLNIPLRGTICPTAEEPGWSGPSAGHSAAAAGRERPSLASCGSGTGVRDVTALLGELGLGPGLRGLIVAGPGCRVPWPVADTLASLTGYPVLADAASGMRRPAVRHLVCEADALVLHPFLAGSRPEVIIRLGQQPVSQTVGEYLAAQACPQLRDVGSEVTGDVLSSFSHPLGTVDLAVARELGDRLGPGDDEWRRWWGEAAAGARRGLERAVRMLPWGESKAVATICGAGGFDFIHLANSMAIRNGNLHLGPAQAPQPVYANRGLNGIDGTVATFIGELRVTSGRGLLLIGDQALLHDLAALGAANEESLRGCICVINNQGGALFDLLPVHRLPGYQEAIRHPVAVDLAAAAQAFRLPFHRCAGQPELAAALAAAQSRDAVSLIEAVVPPGSLAGELTKLVLTMVRGSVLQSRLPKLPKSQRMLSEWTPDVPQESTMYSRRFS
jgi:2-succinyl-5-enolpyruvyl-6-hydroxy-3-cyclohexene-1-carboxylate synthase